MPYTCFLPQQLARVALAQYRVLHAQRRHERLKGVRAGPAAAAVAALVALKGARGDVTAVGPAVGADKRARGGGGAVAPRHAGRGAAGAADCAAAAAAAAAGPLDLVRLGVEELPLAVQRDERVVRGGPGHEEAELGPLHSNTWCCLAAATTTYC